MPEKNDKVSMSLGPFGSVNKRKGGRAKMGGPFTEGAHVSCTCPSCGYTMAYIASEPCANKLCPKCRNKMTKK